MHRKQDNSNGGNDMSLETRVAVLENAITYIKDGIQRIESRNDRIDTRIDMMDKKFDSRLDNLDRKLTNDFRWLLALILGLSGGLAGIMAHGFHWF